MKKTYKIFMVLVLLTMQNQLFSSIYFWQMNTLEGQSCCLHINGYDICNPDKPCTKSLTHDLSSMMQYVSRVLSTDKPDQEDRAYLLRMQRYMRSVLLNPYSYLSYRFDQQRKTSFLHDKLDTKRKKNQKDSKDGSTAKSKEAAKKEKDKKERYEKLAKLGLIVKR